MSKLLKLMRMTLSSDAEEGFMVYLQSELSEYISGYPGDVRVPRGEVMVPPHSPILYSVVQEIPCMFKFGDQSSEQLHSAHGILNKFC